MAYSAWWGGDFKKEKHGQKSGQHIKWKLS